jgi:hypothetical protein
MMIRKPKPDILGTQNYQLQKGLPAGHAYDTKVCVLELERESASVLANMCTDN